MDEALYFQSQQAGASDNSFHSISEMVNYRDAIFVLAPKLNYEFHRDYKEAKKKYELLGMTYQDKKHMDQMEPYEFINSERW